ncbi:MAG: DUF1674 domain-containing protein [Xanthobacteraceae bacterium]
MSQQNPDEAAERGDLPSVPAPQGGKPLSPAAQRALAEAAARRAASDATPTERPKELRGRGGLDPVRYGDWEKDGLASDF